MTLLSPSPAATDAPVAGRPRIALYGHDTVGLGHLRRNLALAEHLGAALAADHGGADVLLVTAAAEAGRFALPDGVELLVLPSVRKDASGGYASGAWQQDLDDVVNLRSSLLAAALEAFAPDLLVVDKCPWGFGGELEPALHALRARGCRLVLGLRDVLDEPSVASAQWRTDRGDDAVRSCYDEVWVYGDRGVHDIAAATAMAPTAAAACRYLGYLSTGRVTEATRPDDVDGPYVLGVCGGGSDGALLADAFVAADPPPGHTGVLVTGPQVPTRDLLRLRATAAARSRPGARVRVVRFSSRAASWAAGAAAVVAMGGANTVAELLATDVPALVVPRTSPRREQLVRAQALAAVGALDAVAPEDLTPQRLSAWTADAVGRRVHRSGVDLGGLSRAGQRAAALLTPLGSVA